MGSKLWFDLEDLFVYAQTEGRPSGIQRLAFEIHQALLADPAVAGRVGFVRHHPSKPLFVEADWAEALALFTRLSRPVARAAQPVVMGRPRNGALRRLFGRAASPQLKVALGRFLIAARAAAKALPPVLPAMAANLRWRPPPIDPDAEDIDSDDMAGEAPFAPGDWLVCLGSTWSSPHYPSRVRRAKQRRRLKFALLVYDVIPLRRPEWCDLDLVRLFKAWLEQLLPLAERVFAISHATARDLESYAAEQGIPLNAPTRVIPIGSGFTDLHPEATQAPVPPPVEGDYVLVVSTIEARKNHILLFRAWRRLLEALPRDQVPVLVFAGRPGWLTGDLMQQLKNADYLDGKIQLVDAPSDAEVQALYRGCRFTLFPSLYEGWGLPVTESFMFGKPCLLSDRSSLPEAGGALGRYFDPENLDDAVRAIRAVIEDPADLAAWEAEVKAKFVPVPWSAAAKAVLEGVDAG
jgi:glycosyltransferase involved in cell wall biosynthesis